MPRKKKTRKRIYVAGAYSSDNVLGVLNNIRKGIRASTELLFWHYAPFSPWLDFQFVLQLRKGEKLTIKDFYEYSMAWLEAADAVFVLPGYKKSIGTLAEIRRAKELNIPIFYKINNLLNNIESD